MTDIVERLRNPAGRGVMHQEAAAEIKRLREHVAALQASSGYEASISQVEIERHMREKVALAGLVAKERDEVERLRAALQDIADNCTYGDGYCEEVARRALEPKP